LIAYHDFSTRSFVSYVCHHFLTRFISIDHVLERAISEHILTGHIVGGQIVSFTPVDIIR